MQVALPKTRGRARSGADEAQVVDDPFLLGYVFGAIAGACAWSGKSACEVDAAIGFAKMGLMKVAFEEALGGPDLVLDAVLRTWRWEREPGFVLGQRLGREASAGTGDSLASLSEWLADAQSRPAQSRRMYC